MDEIVLSFEGLDADAHHLKALSGIESANGIARALTIIGHYAATGVVRHRFPFSDDVSIYLEGAEDGSFNWVLKVIIGPLALGLGTNAVYDLAKLTMSSAIGDQPPAVSKQVQALSEDRPGDIAALVQAIEPSLKQAHYGIGHTAHRITITETTTTIRSVIVRFDSRSKSYLDNVASSSIEIQDVSIPALSVNQRTGRAYFHDLKHTVAFTVPKDAAPRTMVVLGSAIERYSNNDTAPIRITFSRIEAPDGRLKRVIIRDAEYVSDQE